MRHGFATILVLGLIVSFIALTIGLYLKQKSTTTEKIITQPSSFPQSPTIDETANWKTYTGYGYSILYPPDFDIYHNQVSEGILDSICITTKKGEWKDAGNCVIYFTVSIKGFDSLADISLEKKKLNNYDALLEQDNKWKIYYIKDIRENVYEIQLPLNQNADIDQVREKILSTFKFLDQK